MRFIGAEKWWHYAWQKWRQPVVEWLSLLVLIAAIVGPVGTLGWLVFFTDTFNIQAITIVDARPQTTDSIRGIISNALGENILFTQTDLLEQRIVGNVPQVRDVHIVRKLPATLKVIVQEKTASLLLLSNGKFHFIDTNGEAYEEARLDELPGLVLPIVKNLDPGVQVTIGSPVMSAEFVAFVQEVQKSLPELAGAEVADIRMPSLAAREVHFLLDNNWLVRFDSTRSSEGQLYILEQLLAGTISEEQKEILEYIDLRIPNRVYYKLTGGGDETEVQNTTDLPDSDNDGE